MEVKLACQCKRRIKRQFANQESLDLFMDYWIEEHHGEGHRPGNNETSAQVARALDRLAQRENEHHLALDLREAQILYMED